MKLFLNLMVTLNKAALSMLQRLEGQAIELQEIIIGEDTLTGTVAEPLSK